MVITKIEIQKRNKEKVNIYVDDEYSFSLTLNGLLESRLNKGDEITQDVIDRWSSKDEPNLAFNKAYEIISAYGMKTEKELRKKLAEKGFSEPSVDYAIERMKGYGYTDDAQYSRSYIQSHAIPQRWGEQKIISHLLQKGVEMETIRNAIAEVYSEDQKQEAIFEAAEKYARKLKGEDKRKDRQKLYSHLASKGFSYDLISEAVNHVFSATDEYD